MTHESTASRLGRRRWSVVANGLDLEVWAVAARGDFGQRTLYMLEKDTSRARGHPHIQLYRGTACEYTWLMGTHNTPRRPKRMRHGPHALLSRAATKLMYVPHAAFTHAVDAGRNAGGMRLKHAMSYRGHTRRSARTTSQKSAVVAR